MRAAKNAINGIIVAKSLGIIRIVRLRNIFHQAIADSSNIEMYDNMVVLKMMFFSMFAQGRDFSGEPGIQAARKSLKLTGNPCWNSQFLHFK